jgi:hypothetical protein
MNVVAIRPIMNPMAAPIGMESSTVSITNTIFLVLDARRYCIAMDAV